MVDAAPAGTIQNTSVPDAPTSLLNSNEPIVPTPTDPVQPDPAQTPKADAAPADPAKATPEAAAATVGAPEKYEFVAPEGVTLNPEALAAFEPKAREMGLTNEQANQLVALQAEIVAKQSAATTESWMNTRKEWVSQTKSDKEIGGANFTQSLNNAKSIVKDYGTPALTKVLDDYGLGDHPEMIRFLAKLGAAKAEDKFVPGTGSASTNLETVMYPTMVKK